MIWRKDIFFTFCLRNKAHSLWLSRTNNQTVTPISKVSKLYAFLSLLCFCILVLHPKHEFSTTDSDILCAVSQMKSSEYSYNSLQNRFYLNVCKATGPNKITSNYIFKLKRQEVSSSFLRKLHLVVERPTRQSQQHERQRCPLDLSFTKIKSWNCGVYFTLKCDETVYGKEHSQKLFSNNFDYKNCDVNEFYRCIETAWFPI